MPTRRQSTKLAICTTAAELRGLQSLPNSEQFSHAPFFQPSPRHALSARLYLRIYEGILIWDANVNACLACVEGLHGHEQVSCRPFCTRFSKCASHNFRKAGMLKVAKYNYYRGTAINNRKLS
eukprot:scaffold469086_cov42-Prasinocladus_malaysianus.AAC.2